MAKGDDFKQDVDKAVAAGSDFSQGGEHAYKALMAEIAKDGQKYQDPAKFDQLGQKVAENLQKNGVLDEHMLRWSRDNMDRFDTSGDKKVDRQEMDPNNPIAVNGFERAMMTRLQETYSSLQRAPEIQPLIGSNGDNDPFSHKDFKNLIEAREKPRTEEHVNEQKTELAARKEAQKEAVTKALLTNDGDPGTSLAAVLDTQKGGERDGKISHGDVKNFIKTFDDPANRGRIGYTPENLRAAQLLNSQWDDDLGKSLRGQYDRNDSNGRGGPQDKITYDKIELKRLAEMRGQSVDEMFASNVGNVGNAGQDRQRSAAVQDNQVRPVSAESNTVGQARPVITAQDDGQDRSAQPVDRNYQPVDNGNNQVVRPEQRPVQVDGDQNQERAVAPNGHVRRPVKRDDDDSQPAPRREQQRPVRRPDHQEQGQEQQHRRPVRDDAHQPRTDAPARKFEAPKPIPELVMPELKAGDDVAKAREAYAKQAEDHFKARADYSVQPGQGWDRVARDVLRQEKDGSHNDERNVVALSEALAKNNGWQGRLDREHQALQPGDTVHVMSAEMVKARIDAEMKKFDAQVEATKAADAKKAAESGPSLFDGKRSGEGTVAPEPGAADQKAADQKVADQKAYDALTPEQKAAFDKQKVADQKAADQKAADQKVADQKTYDALTPDQKIAFDKQKSADQQVADQKAADQKVADQKAADQKAADQQAADQKAADQKAADQKAADQKAAGDKTVSLNDTKQINPDDDSYVAPVAANAQTDKIAREKAAKLKTAVASNGDVDMTKTDIRS